MDSANIFNQLDLSNDILDMRMINSPSIDSMNGPDEKRDKEPKGLLEKYVGTFQQQQQQQQQQRRSDYSFGPDDEDTSTLGPTNNSRLGMNLDDSEEDSPTSRPGDMETNSGDSLHQTHRQFLQHLQSMTAQQFHQAAMGSSSATSLGNNNGAPMNAGNRVGTASWGGGYQTSSARFDDSDLLALMGDTQSPDEPNQPRKPSQSTNGEFRQMMNDLHQHHLASDPDPTTKLFSVSQQSQDGRGSYAPVEGQGFVTGHQLQQGPLGAFPASAPAAFQDGFPGRLGAETDHFGRLGGIGGAVSAMGYGGYSYHPQSGLGEDGDQRFDMNLHHGKGIPVSSSSGIQGNHATLDSLSRQVGQGTPSLIDGSVSSLGNASLFSSIMGGQWGMGDGHRNTYQAGGFRGQAGQGGYHDSKSFSSSAVRRLWNSWVVMVAAVSVFSHGDGTGENDKSPDSLGDDRDRHDKIKNGVDDKTTASRGRTKSTSKMGGVGGDKAIKGKPKLARRSSSIAAAASGGSAVRNETAGGPGGGIGKAPRAPSKTRPAHKRTGSNASRVPNATVPGPTSSSSSGPGSGNGTVSPAQFEYALPSLEATFQSHRPDAQRKRSESAAMTVDRASIELPLFRGHMNEINAQHSAAHMMSMGNQRRSSMARTPSSASTLGVFPDVGDEGLWRRHSMNDAVRPDLVSFGMGVMTGDGMATVDEAAIEDGDAEDSPPM